MIAPLEQQVPIPSAELPRLLAGPPLGDGAEPLRDHLARLGRRPEGGPWLVDVLRESGLRGRGGAGFPAWRKWDGVAALARRRPVVVVNGAEGEPLSAKDRTLLCARPHLVLDGAALAAETVGTTEIYLYVAAAHRDVVHALRRAVRERRRSGGREPSFHLLATEHRYVAGQSSAAAQRISGGAAKPRFTPPHVSERGVFGRPTLVSNAETFAHAALLARRGARWFRSAGTHEVPGTTLVTVAGNVARPGVYEVDPALSVESVLEVAGGSLTPPAGALLGGYFGSWAAGADLARTQLADALGCGVVAVLPAGGCGIVESARVTAYLAAETAGQCGPCVQGLPALAGALRRLAASEAVPTDLDRLRRWSRLIDGRGACSHPDGAVRQVLSALDAFADHLPDHLEGRRCPGASAGGFPQPPKRGWLRWRS